MGGDMGRSALDSQRGGIAVLDSAGIVTWTDEAWGDGDDRGNLPRLPIGTNLLESYRGYADLRARAVADAIAAIFEGKATYFEIEHRPDRASENSYLTSVAALRGDGGGVVVIHKVVGGRETPDSAGSSRVKATDASPLKDVDRLTPREREVLDLMTAGLDNRAIAARLRIEYTTVRGHVRSVIEKLGARSRLEAVALAYQSGWKPTR